MFGTVMMHLQRQLALGLTIMRQPGSDRPRPRFHGSPWVGTPARGGDAGPATDLGLNFVQKFAGLANQPSQFFSILNCTLGIAAVL